MRQNKKGAAARTALAGMLAALGVVVLFAGYATGVMDLTALCVTSVLTAVAVVELGGAYPYMVWGVTSVISFVILPDKSLAAGYLLFGGIYPVLKLYFEQIRSRVLEWAVKLLYGGAVLGALYLMSRFLFGLETETGWLAAALAAGYAVFFVVYDFALNAAMTMYMRRIRGKLTFLRRLK